MVERSAKKDGARIAAYLAYVGFKTPQPWCAAFVSYCFGQAGYSQPRTAWSPSLFPKERLVKDLSILRDDEKMPEMVYGMYFSKLGLIGHCGLVESVRNFCHNFIDTLLHF
ncbi:hypothetical protein D3C86_1884990 [compost metagenome]